MLNIGTDLSGATLTFNLEGVLDTKTSPDLVKALEDCFSDVDEIIFDFKNLEYITSAGLRALLVAKQEMTKKGGEIAVKNVSRDVMTVFKDTGFAKLFNIK